MNQHRSAARKTAAVPPPPGPEASDAEVIAYHKKYSLDELEQAGHAAEPPPGEEEELTAAANYQWLRENGLHIKLTRREYEQLSRLAARKDVRVEKLAARWIRERLRREAGK